MAKRPSLGAFSSTLTAAETRPHDALAELPMESDQRLPITAGPAPPVDIDLRQRKRGGDGAKSAVFIRVTPEGLAAVQALADELGTYVQDLGVVALNDLLAKYGRSAVIKTPTRR